jgi:hypothetical protein
MWIMWVNYTQEKEMSTQIQLIANQKNAQLSTGPRTAFGKAIVAKNAIRHGIFTKDLILTSGSERESEDEYLEILQNLMDCLCPSNQLESLLVEKIAVDFWRLRRTIRFETGSVIKNIQSQLKEFYSHGRKNDEEIDEEIRRKENLLEWNLTYIECLSKGEVTFDQPKWKGRSITSDIVDDFYMLAKEIPSLSKDQRERLYYGGDFTFDELRLLLQKGGYSEADKITTKLLELYYQQNKHLEEEIQQLIKKKITNDESNKLLYMLGMIPNMDNAEKVLKYERGLQKSIYQNLIMLKKLQGLF